MAQETEQTGQLHEPVLLKEVLEWLRPEQGGTFLDCTLGLGGHSEAILKASPDVKVIGIDRDGEALELARERLRVFEGRVQTVQANFAELPSVIDRLGVAGVRGVLADLGVSSLQLDRADRGFSFASDAPLDMRMDRDGGETAASLVNDLTEGELADLIFGYGEERGSRRIARAIVREREREPITTTRRLADVIVRALHVRGRWRIHPATRTFQALRIAVNGELDSLEAFIPAAISALGRGGRLAIISFHSLEDRIVKRAFLRESGRCICQIEGNLSKSLLQERRAKEVAGIEEAVGGEEEVICDLCGARARVNILTRKPVRADQDEVERNPRSRSALLRACERI